MKPDSSNRFQAFVFEDGEKDKAMMVSPYFLAYLQNKIAAYAFAAVDAKIEYDPDPTKQLKAILEHERLRNFVTAYEELLAELTDHQPESPITGV